MNQHQSLCLMSPEPIVNRPHLGNAPPSHGALRMPA